MTISSQNLFEVIEEFIGHRNMPVIMVGYISMHNCDPYRFVCVKPQNYNRSELYYSGDIGFYILRKSIHTWYPRSDI